MRRARRATRGKPKLLRSPPLSVTHTQAPYLLPRSPNGDLGNNTSPDEPRNCNQEYDVLVSICACHPCATVMLIFAASFQFVRMISARVSSPPTQQRDTLGLSRHPVITTLGSRSALGSPRNKPVGCPRPARWGPSGRRPSARVWLHTIGSEEVGPGRPSSGQAKLHRSPDATSSPASKPETKTSAKIRALSRVAFCPSLSPDLEQLLQTSSRDHSPPPTASPRMAMGRPNSCWLPPACRRGCTR